MHILSFSWSALRLFPSWAVCEQDSRERSCTGFYADTCSFLQSMYLGMKLLGPVPPFNGFYFEIIYSKLKKKKKFPNVLCTFYPVSHNGNILHNWCSIISRTLTFIKHTELFWCLCWHALMCVRVCGSVQFITCMHLRNRHHNQTQNCCCYKMKPHANIHLRPHPSFPIPDL